jgi:hypothetical protein
MARSLDTPLYSDLAVILGKERGQLTPIRTVGSKDKNGQATGDLEGCHSVIDVVMNVTGLERNQSAQVFRRICEHYADVDVSTANFQFEGQGQRETPVAKIAVIVEIIMLAPGCTAAAVRRQCAQAFVRYLGGDLSLIDEVMGMRRVQEALSTESPSHFARVFGEAVEVPTTTPKTTPLKRRAIEEETTKLIDVVAKKTRLSGSKLKAFTLLATEAFIELRVREEPEVALADLNRRYNATSLGQNTRVPTSQLEMAHSVIEMLQAPQGAMPCRGPERLSTTSSRSSGFCALTPEHSRAKDMANAQWISLLPSDGPVFYLDAFTEKEGFDLRTTNALLSVRRANLYSANPDEGIVKRMRNLGVVAHLGTWSSMPTGPKFVGIYLDLCSGSASFVSEQLELAMFAAASHCVLAWTITERDFNGEDLILRQIRITDLLQSRRWKPACGNLLTSTLLHRASGSQHRVLTQFWAR